MKSITLNTYAKSIVLFLLLCCFGLPLNAQVSLQNETWTLRECVEYALENNINIKQSRLDLKAAEIDKSDALGNYLPSINASANNTWNSGLTQNVTTGVLEQQTTRNFSVGATASIPIFHGLKNLREWQRAKLSKLASQYALGKMKDDIRLNVANAYLNILVNKEHLAILKAQNKLTQQQLRRTRILIREGSAPAGDSLNIKATNANEQQQIVVAKNNIRIALINLAQILQIDDYKNFEIAAASFDVPINTILSKSPQDIIEHAKDTRYEIKMAQQNLKLAQKDLEISKSNFYPHLDAFINFNTRASGIDRYVRKGIDPNNPTQVIGHVSTTGDPVVTPNFMLESVGPQPFFDQLSENKGWSYGFRLSIPILNGFSTRNSVKRQEITIQRREYQLQQAKLDLESNIYQAYVDAQGAAKAYQAAQLAVKAQKKAFEYAQVKYDYGEITAFEFSEAKYNLSNAQSELVNAKYDYIFKLKVLELYFGVEPEDINF